MILRIEQVATDSETIFTLIGRITSPDVQQLKAEIAEAPNRVALDLDQVALVDLDAVHFLAAAEQRGIALRRLPQYIREWILLEKVRLVALPPATNETREDLTMERMLVVVFDNEKKAYEGKSALHQVEREGDVAIYAEAVVIKHADGSVSVKEENDSRPLGTIVGTSLGTLIGLLGGPVGLAIGATTGFAFGSLADLDTIGVGEDFLGQVSASLTPNKVAVIAQIEESWTTPVDTRMEAIGGTVFRRALWQVREGIADKEVAAMKADLAQLKEEMAKARDDRRAKLQKKVDQLQAAIDAQVQKAKERHAAFEALRKSKKEILDKNAAAAGRALKELATTPV